MEQIAAEIQLNDKLRVEILPSFVGAWGRKLYTTAPGRVMQFPEGHAHAHGSPELIVAISGNTTLALGTPTGKVEYLQLEIGSLYTIPPNIPHQVELRDGILESLFPTEVYENGIPMRELRTNYFAKQVKEASTI